MTDISSTNRETISHTAGTLHMKHEADKTEWKRMHESGDLRMLLVAESRQRDITIDLGPALELASIPSADDALSIILTARRDLQDLPETEEGIPTWVHVLKPGSDELYDVTVGRSLEPEAARAFARSVTVAVERASA